MSTATAVLPGSVAREEVRASPVPAWLHGIRWDGSMLVGSVLIVPAVLVMVWAGASSDAINIGTTILVGGPHLFATLVSCYLDPEVRRHHGRVLLWTAGIIPAVVVCWTLFDFQTLLSFFIFMASLHVLQQNAYLADVYRLRGRAREPVSSRLLDYAVLLLSFYPIATYRLVGGDFALGSVKILIPPFVRHPATYWAVGIAFAVAAALWIRKTVREGREGRLNAPKTLLIGVTVVTAFLVPIAASGERLELAFQAVNAWHSFQYLAIVWFVQAARKEAGVLRSPFLRSVSGPGRPAFLFYGLCSVITLSLLGVVVLLTRADPWGIPFQEYYYMGVLSFLLLHYALDGYFFFLGSRPGAPADRIPLAAAVATG